MTTRRAWTRHQLLVAFSLYCQIPFGRLDSRNLKIIQYAELIGRTPSALAMKLSNIASLDPAITSTGRKGLKGASSADRSMWEEMQNNWGPFVEESESIMRSIAENSSSENEQPESDPSQEFVDYSGKNKLAQSKIRVGQSFFRKAVLSAYNEKCCITGLSIPRLLVASHIVPWKDDKSNRLNPKNGLSLSMLHDKAFDLGIITITEEMTVHVSRKELISEDPFFESSIRHFEGRHIALPEKFQPHADFLAYHREHIFEE